MSVMKRGLTRPLLFTTIADQMEEMMAAGRISHGDRLPAERQLAAHLKVSRSTVREAIRVLEQKGLVEIRRGRKGGAYVRPPVHRLPAEDLGALERLSLNQITDFRLTIEGHITALAARTADPTDIRRLKRQLETARALMNRGRERVDAYIEADRALHICVAQIAGNPLFTEALDAALVLKPHFCPLLHLNPCLMETNYEDLVGIVGAIEAGSSEAASRATRAHITRFNDAVG